MPACRRMFQTTTGKPFCPNPVVAAPKPSGGHLADENPARQRTVAKGGSGGAPGTLMMHGELWRAPFGKTIWSPQKFLTAYTVNLFRKPGHCSTGAIRGAGPPFGP